MKIHRVFGLAFAFGLSLAAVMAANAQPQSLAISQVPSLMFERQAEFFPPSSTFDLVFSGGCGVMEGLASAPDGRVFFTEITRSTQCADARGVPGGRIWVMEPGAARPRVFREPSGMAAGVAIDAEGGLVVAEGADHGFRRVSRTDLATGEYRVIAYLFENRQLNAPNDVAVDGRGRVYFSDPRLFGPETIDQRIFGVYRLDKPAAGAKGTWPITRILANSGKINGIELSPDGRTLYAGFCDPGSNALGEQPPVGDLNRNGNGGLVAYDLDDQGTPSRPKVWLDLQNSGCVDGMTTDAEGNLYVAVLTTLAPPGIHVFSPTGQLLARLVLPDKELAVNLGFGRGADARTLYIATVGVGKVYRYRAGKAGL